MKRHVRLIVTTLIAAKLIVTALTVGDAGEGGRPRPDDFRRLGDPRQYPFASGRVTAVNKKTITVEMPGLGTRTIAVTAKTKISKQAEGKLSDVEKGTKVIVSGKPSEDGKTMEARFIALNLPQLNPPQPNIPRRVRSPGSTFGQVASAASLVVKTDDGKTVTLRIKKGARVIADGTPSADGKTVEARHVNVSDSPLSGFNNLTGVVTSTAPLTVKADDGRSVTVKTTAETRVMTTKTLTIADVKKSDHVSAQGKPGANGVLEAETVYVMSGVTPVLRRDSGPPRFVPSPGK